MVESFRLIRRHMVLLEQTNEPKIRYANIFEISLNIDCLYGMLKQII